MLTMIIAAVQLPPPINGLTLISERVLRSFIAANCHVETIRLAPAGIGRKSRLARRALRGWHAIYTYISLIRHVRALPRQRSAFYIAISGGFGKIFELPTLAIARMLGCSIVIHHHSFAYLHKQSWLCQLVLWTAGRNSIQICLGKSMERRLNSLYGLRLTYTVSNAMFLPELEAEPDARRFVCECREICLGFLGNIEPAKGIFEFIETVRILKRRGAVIRAVVAGPFVDAAVQKEVLSRTSDLAEISFIGPVFGDSKRDFFKSIDILLFPTAYVNEAEPVVILEALASAVVVFASERGCIGDLLCGDLAVCCLPHAEFSGRAAELTIWLASSAQDRVDMARRARARAEQAARQSSNEFAAMIQEVSRRTSSASEL